MGRDWIRRFDRFDVRPIAAASIGQVHRARTRDGRDLALYPGIRASIDSDIANMAGLIRWSGATPHGLDLRPLMEDARRQLHEEADYVREGQNLDLFGRLMADAPEFVVPRRHPDFCTRNVLAMDILRGAPVEGLAASPQEVRDEVARRLISLVLRELFEFKAMQTDPNFANYLVEPETGRIVLLDFGAVRSLSPASVDAFRRLMRAGLSRDVVAAREAAIAVGLMGEATPTRQQETILRMFNTGMAAIRAPDPSTSAQATLPSASATSASSSVPSATSLTSHRATRFWSSARSRDFAPGSMLPGSLRHTVRTSTKHRPNGMPGFAIATARPEAFLQLTKRSPCRSGYRSHFCALY